MSVEQLETQIRMLSNMKASLGHRLNDEGLDEADIEYIEDQILDLEQQINDLEQDLIDLDF